MPTPAVDEPFWYREYRAKAAAGDDLQASGRGDRFGVAQYLKIVAHVVRSLGPTPSDRLLDVGCGPGLMTILLAPLCREVIGVEPVAELAAQARAHTAHAGNVRVTLGESWALPVRSGSVERLVCYGVLQLVEGADAVTRTLGEMARVLRRPGRALVGSIPDLGMRDTVLPPYLAGVERAAHLSAEQKAAIVARNRRAQWFDPDALARSARAAGFVVSCARPPAELGEPAERFELVLELT